MNTTLQAAVVFVIVATALSYALLKLMPRAWRQALAARAATLAMRSGFSAVQARRVEAKLASGGACGSCDSCKACSAPAAQVAPFDDAVEGASAVYRKIPIRPTS